MPGTVNLSKVQGWRGLRSYGKPATVVSLNGNSVPSPPKCLFCFHRLVLIQGWSEKLPFCRGLQVMQKLIMGQSVECSVLNGASISPSKAHGASEKSRRKDYKSQRTGRSTVK